MADAQETADRMLCVNALTVAIDTTVDEEARWYVSPHALELVCLNLCVAYRSSWNIAPREVVVAADTPSRVWLRGKSSGALRVPPLPVRAVMVEEWPEGVLAGLLEGQHRVSATTTGRIVKRRIVRLVLPRREPLWWPASLKKLSFDSSFNRSIAKVVWPASLEELSFGWRFNQPIAKVVWPPRCGSCRSAGCSTSPWSELFGRPHCSNYRSGIASTSPSSTSCGQPPWSFYRSGTISTSPSLELCGQPPCCI